MLVHRAYAVDRSERHALGVGIVVSVTCAEVQAVWNELELSIEVAEHLVVLVAAVVVLGSCNGVVEVACEAYA